MVAARVTVRLQRRGRISRVRERVGVQAGLGEILRSVQVGTAEGQVKLSLMGLEVKKKWKQVGTEQVICEH